MQACIVEEELHKLTTGQGDGPGCGGMGRESEKGLRDLLVVQAVRWREGEEVQNHRIPLMHLSDLMYMYIGPRADIWRSQQW